MKTVERFFSKVKYSHDCWVWDSSRNQKGYGEFSIKENGQWKNKKAHRWSFEYFIEPLNDKWCLHHCDNPACVNPFHLFKGNNSDNMLDCVSKNRHNHARKDFCKNGHRFDRLNTYITKEGHRSCRACKKIAKKRFMRKRRGSDGKV